MSKITIDENLKGKELFEFLVTNKSLLIAEKKYNVKHSDAFTLSNYFVNTKGEVVKSNPVNGSDTIQATSVINTTNLMDSHKDVHIPGLWKKSLSEKKSIYLLQEHSMSFKGIITDEVKAFTKQMTWKELGYDADGITEALIFVSTIHKGRNEYMYNQYKSGYVKNHSVGMRYVNIEMAINDEDYKAEFATWNKYIDQIVNKGDAEENGYFFPVLEAKVVEGSAVPIGSNWITPTLEVKTDTGKEPALATHEQPLQKSFNIHQILQII